MTLEVFISILVISATATSIAIEIIKNLLDNARITYKTMPVAVSVAFIIGVVEIYTASNEFSKMTIMYSICMGIANVIGSNVGYDKVKELLYTLFPQK